MNDQLNSLAGFCNGKAESMSRMFFIFSLIFIGSAFSEGEIVRIGPEIQPVPAVIDNAEGSVFLMNDVVLNHGILFAFSAFFVNPTRIYFQVWRPVPGDGTNYQLVFQTSMAPSTTGKIEEFYVVSTLRDRCSVVQNGDKVGVYFPTGPPAISRFFDPLAPSSFRYRTDNASIPLEVNTTVRFDTLLFPYKLNVQAWILVTNASLQVDSTQVSVECPKVLIPHPEETTISPGATGATGPSGATGPPGLTGRDGDTGSIGPVGNPGPPGATGSSGAQGATGALGQMGARGPEGAQGWVGASGPIGERGDTGVIGPMGPPGPPGSPQPVQDLDSSSGCSGPMRSDGFMLGMLIWLVILTLLLLTILVGLVVLCIELRTRRDQQDEDGLLDLGKELKGSKTAVTSTPVTGQHTTTTRPNDYDFSGAGEDQLTDLDRLRMRGEEFSHFALDTIETDGGGGGGEARPRRLRSVTSAGGEKAVYEDLPLETLNGISNPVYDDEDAEVVAMENEQTNDVIDDAAGDDDVKTNEW